MKRCGLTELCDFCLNTVIIVVNIFVTQVYALSTVDTITRFHVSQRYRSHKNKNSD